MRDHLQMFAFVPLEVALVADPTLLLGPARTLALGNVRAQQVEGARAAKATTS